MEFQTNQNVIEEQLSFMGYSAPNWDEFQINKTPTTAPVSPTLLPTDMTKKQQFLLKVWPKVEGFYQEDEDLTVILHAETIKKNGLVTRVFRLIFDNEKSRQRWQFVLEKRFDSGSSSGNVLDQDVRQIWAKTTPDLLEEVQEKFIYARGFDTLAQSSKFKTNREDGSVITCQKGFLREIKGTLVDAFQSSDPFVADDLILNDANKLGGSYFKGKELEFEENGHQIVWTLAIRRRKLQA